MLMTMMEKSVFRQNPSFLSAFLMTLNHANVTAKKKLFPKGGNSLKIKLYTFFRFFSRLTISLCALFKVRHFTLGAKLTICYEGVQTYDLSKVSFLCPIILHFWIFELNSLSHLWTQIKLKHHVPWDMTKFY